MSLSVKWYGQPVEEVIEKLHKRLEQYADAAEAAHNSTNAVITIRANINNEKLSDKEFRDFVNNTL